jgi:hypothetical protein
VQSYLAAREKEVARHLRLRVPRFRAGENHHRDRQPWIPGRKLQKRSAAADFDVIRVRADGQHPARALS